MKVAAERPFLLSDIISTGTAAPVSPLNLKVFPPDRRAREARHSWREALHWQTPARGNFDHQRLFGALANRLAQWC
jgi:hypothetical protein